MPESIQLQTSFQKGLRDDVRTARNAEVLSLCTNAKASQWGAGKHEPISWPVTDVAIADVAAEFPKASLFRGKSKTILARATSIYEVNESTWAAGTAKTVYRLGPPQTESLNNVSFETDGGGPSYTVSNWTAGGAALADGVPAGGWTYNKTTDLVAHAAAGGITGLQQVSGSQAIAIVAGHVYRVRFTISGMTAGSVMPYVGTTGTGTARTQNKLWTQDIVCAGTATFSITPTTDFDGSITDVSVREVKTGTIPTGSGPWQMADFQDVIFLCNGTCLVARLYIYGRWGWFVVQNEDDSYPLVPKAICNFKNRLLIGGLPASTTYWSDADWTDLWTVWLEHTPKDVMTYQDLTMGSNIWVYSDRGGGDYYYPFFLFLTMLGVLGQTEVDTVKYLYEDRLRAREMGFLPMPWQGNILAGIPLGEALASYGDNGITASLPQAEADMSVFQTIELGRIGVAARGAASGDLQANCFIDKAGVVWVIGPDLKIGKENRRGYAEFISALTDANIVVALDPDQRDFHITDGVIGYVVSTTGLGKSTRFPTTLTFTSTGLVGVYAPAAAENTAFEIITDTFDMGTRGIKTIKHVDIAATNVTNLKVSVEFKFNKTSTFFRTAEIPVTDEGQSTPIASGTDFRLRLTGTWGTNGKIDYANIDWTLDDKRSVGGYISGH